MSNPIAVYLNNHLAGSTVTLTLLEQLRSLHAGTDLERFLTNLHADTAADRQELETLMSRLHVPVSAPSKSLDESKHKSNGRPDGPLALLEALEAVALGIDGKRILWRSLIAAAELSPTLKIADFERLERRAEEQRCRVETHRIEAARHALTTAS
jgi:hypothetical protein